MTRVQHPKGPHRRHKKTCKIAKGFRGSSSVLFKIANQQLLKALKNGFVDRRLRKRNFRSVWIGRINANVRSLGLNYHSFIHQQQKKKINRKILAQLALYDPSFFL